MKSKANKFGFWKIITIVILLGVFVFLLYPITRLLIQSFYNKEGNLSLAICQT